MFRSYLPRIRHASKTLEGISDKELLQKSLDLKYRAMTGATIEQLIIPGFALVIEAAKRNIQQTPYNVQLTCGMNMVYGHIAEMKTGEGKTLTASLPTFLFALFGKGVHVATFNDYLAQRDREFLLPVYSALGLSVGIVTGDTNPAARSSEYACDITYAPAKELGFDFLRDRLTVAGGNPGNRVMRGTQFAIIDEADSILIDEARTPLIIAMVNESEESVRKACFRWSALNAGEFVEKQHFTYDQVRHKVELTPAGIRLVRSLPQNNGTRCVSIRELYDYVENAIKVRRDFKLDKTYAIVDEEIVIIDEFTGRPAEGRQWQNGIHQSVQAKEGVPITPASDQAATITIQSYFKRYDLFCGMTGTAWTSRRELKKVYGKKVVRIPTHRPIQRKHLLPRVFATESQKFEAVAKSAKEIIGQNRAVLIGTRSIAKSEQLAAEMKMQGIEFQILNARHLELEAEIIESAGQSARVTIATNMAGRGTDIKLAESVRQAGGLHVILTEIHEAERIDWQMIGRGSRQGDPGSYQIFLSCEDEILKTGLGDDKALRIRKRYRNSSYGQLRSLYPMFRRAQKNTQRRHLIDRLMVQRSDLERQKSLFATGQDPFLNTVSG